MTSIFEYVSLWDTLTLTAFGLAVDQSCMGRFICNENTFVCGMARFFVPVEEHHKAHCSARVVKTAPFSLNRQRAEATERRNAKSIIHNGDARAGPWSNRRSPVILYTLFGNRQRHITNVTKVMSWFTNSPDL